MKFEQIQKLNKLWEEREKIEERFSRLEEALILLAQLSEKRMAEIEHDK